MITYEIPDDEELDLLYDAKEKSYEISLDELDCSKACSRVSTGKTFDEIVDIYKKSNFEHSILQRHVVFQVRNSGFHVTHKKDHILVGMRTCENHSIDSIDYFIFINVDKKYLDYFIDEYRLKKFKKFTII